MCVCVCTVTDFSAAALPIGVKFCTAVRPHLRQVISYFVGIAPWGDGQVLGVKGVIWRGMLLVEALLLFFLLVVTCCTFCFWVWKISPTGIPPAANAFSAYSRRQNASRRKEKLSFSVKFSCMNYNNFIAVQCYGGQ